MTHRRQQGFALLIVLWTIGFLALLGTQILAAGRSDSQLAGNLRQEAELQAAADGAVANVMFTMLAARDPRLRPDGIERELRVGQIPVLVRVNYETDRINLNTASPALLRALIIDVGGPPALANRLASAIVGWRDNSSNDNSDAAQAPQYRAAGLSYGPPGTPFSNVDELADVLGMTPEMFARLAPHLTVLTNDDPDMGTRDPVVASALADTAGVTAVPAAPLPPDTDSVLRIHVVALGSGNARAMLLVVATANFQNTTPRINILLRQRINTSAPDASS